MATVQILNNSNMYQHLPLDIHVLQNKLQNKKIPRYLVLKESLENIDGVYQKLMGNIPLDYIEIPPNIKTQMLKYFGISVKDFRPGYRTSDKMCFANSLLNCIIETRLSNLELDVIIKKKEPYVKYIMDYVKQEISSALGVRENNQFAPEIRDNFIQEFFMSDSVFAYDKNYLSSLFVNNHVGIIFGPEYFISFSKYTDFVICFHKKQILISNDNNIAMVNLVPESDGNLKINVGIKANKITQFITGKTLNDNTVEICYKYKDDSRIKLCLYHKKYANGDEYEISNKNGLVVQTKHYWKPDITNIISQCTITDGSTGLRFRGKVEINKSENKITSKKLTLDDQVQYEKSGDQVLVDKISRINLSGEMIIGWKVGKNSNGEKRIIKLGIPPDARTVIPIDEEYYLNNQKERADQAIVMDILLPDESDEISVVPHETTVYSYVYSNGPKFEYKIGQLVKPDEFNENCDIGCANGIHFFRDKANLYASYINNQ